MKSLVFLLFLTPLLALADKQLTTKDMSALGKIDENTIQSAQPNKAPIGPETPAKSKFSVSCKEVNGVEFKVGEVGYDACLNNLKNRSEFNKRNSGLNNKDNKESNGSSLNFKLGE